MCTRYDVCVLTMYLLKGYICKSVPITGRLYIPDGPGILSNGLAAVTLDPVTIPLVWITLLANILTSMIISLTI